MTRYPDGEREVGLCGHPSGRTRIHDAMTWKAENLMLMREQQVGGNTTAK